MGFFVRGGGAALWLVLLLTALQPVIAQPGRPPLFLVDEETNVSRISFRFDSTQTFDEDLLAAQIATTEPGFFDRVKRVLPLMDPAPHPFTPLELQRDVARLRFFYRENGFLQTRIDYAPSRLDTAANRIHIVFRIDEGDPVRVRSLTFVGLAGEPFPDPEDEAGRTFRKAVTIEPGDRYSTAERLQTQSQVLAWLKNHGFAFAQVRDTVAIDSTALAADLHFVVDPGPVAYFDDVRVEGNRSVGRNVIVRELPFERGERFSEKELTQGQREVFSLNLFRTALTELPEQPRDSTVSVVVHVREGRPQLVTYRFGYDREGGLQVEGDYTHRNFSGAARTLTTSVVARGGLGATPTGGRPAERLFRVTSALRQPYLLVTQLSGTVAPFVQFARDPLIEAQEGWLGVNTQEYGLTTTLLYEVLPFRTVSLQHAFSRARLLVGPSAGAGVADRFNRSILTLSGTFGRSDDYLNPARGVLVRPTLEMAGRVFGSGVQYYKAASEVTAYAPLGRRTGIAGRLVAGRLWPTGASRDQDDPIVENRFDPIRFYGGGGSDLRGWSDRLAGPKVVRASVVEGDTLGFFYEPVGGLSKLALNAELRLPFPGLGPAWGTAVFLDAGRLGEGGVGLGGLRYGTGLGLRYRTPVGFLRLDLAYKINPDPQDLRTPRAFFYEGEAADAKWLRRFKLHLSIGQTF